jgi:hypothetical protein
MVRRRVSFRTRANRRVSFRAKRTSTRTTRRSSPGVATRARRIIRRIAR